MKHEREDAAEITKTTYSMIRKPLEVALERRRVLGVVAPRALPRLHHRLQEVLLEEAHGVGQRRLVQVRYFIFSRMLVELVRELSQCNNGRRVEACDLSSVKGHADPPGLRVRREGRLEQVVPMF